jgi:hypothetical protein
MSEVQLKPLEDDWGNFFGGTGCCICGQSLL